MRRVEYVHDVHGKGEETMVILGDPRRTVMNIAVGILVEVIKIYRELEF